MRGKGSPIGMLPSLIILPDRRRLSITGCPEKKNMSNDLYTPEKKK